ncbi:hypothetical protein [Prosthecobacter sp.]|uniref:hypothetical protein n=1 Tax=Prosthecobacter sp. TaxID=1965333 RepID=UPI003783CD65
MNPITQSSIILLAASLLLSSCSAPRPLQAAPAVTHNTGASTARTVWQKEVPASAPAMSDHELMSKVNRASDPNTSAAERARLMKAIMNSSNHIEGVIQQ